LSTGPTEPGSEFSDFFHTDELPTGPVGDAGRRHSHRGDREFGPLAGRFVAPLTAVAVVVVVILLLIWINGSSPGKNPGPGVVSGSTPPVVVIPTPTTSASTRPSVRASPSTRPKPVSSVVSTHPVRQGPGRQAMAPVQVLNNSRITGLAARAAAEVHAKGWRIEAVGNLQGLVPETTVYYAPGERSAAVHLKHEFASIARIEPAAAGHITTHGHDLTLVVTRDWTG
jgi:hypothetical protein